MNNDLISREALKKKFERLVDETIPYGGVAVNDMRGLIDNAPTVEPHYVSDLPDDVVKTLQTLAIDYSDGIAIFERKRTRGEWAFDEKGNFYCDQCGKYPHDQYATTDFCPNCGTLMKGGAENGKDSN